MKVTWPHVGLIFAGFTAASLGFLFKRHHLETGVVSAGKTEVKIKATVRGSGGRIVKNARISAFDPEQIILGSTNEDGILDTRVLLTSGKSIVLQADGIAFKMRRDLLIPRSQHYQASVFFDLAEVHEGNATLISASNSESTSLVAKPTPPPPWLEIDFSSLKLDTFTRENLLANLTSAARELQKQKKTKLTCQTWQETPPVHECTQDSTGEERISFLANIFPDSVEAAKTWIEEIEKTKPSPLSKTVAATETVFVVRHGGQSARVYFGNKPLSVWKIKNGSTIYRAPKPDKSKPKQKVELTVISESGLVLQKNISWPSHRKIIITRLPRESGLSLSQRKSER